MTKSVRQRYWLWVAVRMVGALVFGVLTIVWSVAFLIPLMIVQFVAAIGLMRLQCDKCEGPILYRDHHVFGIRAKAFWGTLPRKCPVCAAPI